MCARRAPTAPLGNLHSRSVPCGHLHKTTYTPGAARVGVLQHEGEICGSAERWMVRAALTDDGLWSVSEVVRAELGKATAHGQGRARSATGGELLPEDDVPSGELIGDQVDGLGALLLPESDDVP